MIIAVFTPTVTKSAWEDKLTQEWMHLDTWQFLNVQPTLKREKQLKKGKKCNNT